MRAIVLKTCHFLAVKQAAVPRAVQAAAAVFFSGSGSNDNASLRATIMLTSHYTITRHDYTGDEG